MKTTQYDNPKPGCYIDESAGSADDCNRRTIEFAEGYGFKTNEPLPSDESEDYSEIISELADDAVEFLNGLEARLGMFWQHDDNSLFLAVDIETAREGVEFVSSKTQDEPDSDFRGEWLHVNDHGNATLYVRQEDGTDKEIWSLV